MDNSDLIIEFFINMSKHDEEITLINSQSKTEQNGFNETIRLEEEHSS
jgi:hypothetical protein